MKFKIYMEPLGPITLAEHQYEEYLRRKVRNLRPHCVKCGRFVPKVSVRTVGSYWGDDWESTGRCATHSSVCVTWERA